MHNYFHNCIYFSQIILCIDSGRLMWQWDGLNAVYEVWTFYWKQKKYIYTGHILCCRTANTIVKYPSRVHRINNTEYAGLQKQYSWSTGQYHKIWLQYQGQDRPYQYQYFLSGKKCRGEKRVMIYEVNALLIGCFWTIHKTLSLFTVLCE